MLAVVALSGLAVAAFHPEATRLVKFLSGERKATAMSLFSVGGNLGFAVGPLLTTAFVRWLGLRGGLLLAIPGVLLGAVMVVRHSEFSNLVPTPAGHPGAAAETDRWAPFAFLTATMVFRSVVFFGLNTFLALYWISNLHQSEGRGNTALSILMFSGVAGALLGGALADHYGRGRIVVGSLLLVPVLLGLFLAIHQVVAATLLLIPLGLMLTANFSVMIVTAQELLPNHLGVASGVTLGIGASVGGIAMPLFGRVADRQGMHASLSWLMVVAAVTALLAVLTERLARGAKLQQATVE